MNHDGEMSSLVEEMRQINTSFYAQSVSLQQSVVSLRRVSVSGLFAKFPRMARTLCAQLEKKICGHSQIVLNSIGDILPGNDKIAGVA